MSINERPGVYTSYEVSGSIYGGRKGAAVGLAADAAEGEAGKVICLNGYVQAQAAFGGGNIVRLAEILFHNGAPIVYAVKVDDGNYADAFKALMEYGDIRFMVCDSTNGGVHMQMRNTIKSGNERSKYRMGVVENGFESLEDILAGAGIINSEYMMIVSHNELGGVPGAVAAAVCGVAAGEDDPALPLNGAELKAIGNIGPNFSDEDTSLLIAGGISPVETVGGKVSIVRGVSSRTKTDGNDDNTWREINTIMIVNEVLPTIRDGLKLKFSRAKNTQQTRGAIRSQVLVALEGYLKREIIDSYGEINVSQAEDDPTVCNVSFAFTVAHGLNKIELKAHITV